MFIQWLHRIMSSIFCSCLAKFVLQIHQTRYVDGYACVGIFSVQPKATQKTHDDTFIVC